MVFWTLDSVFQPTSLLQRQGIPDVLFEVLWFLMFADFAHGFVLV